MTGTTWHYLELTFMDDIMILDVGVICVIPIHLFNPQTYTECLSFASQCSKNQGYISEQEPKFPVL